jgi:hypothetical protein
VTDPSQDAGQEWKRFARELATMDDVVTRLLDAHVPDDARRCTCCTTPGRGTPQLPWPCALWTLARTAQAIRTTWGPAQGEPPDRRSSPT